MKYILIFTGGLHPSKADFEGCIRVFERPSLVIAADAGLKCAEKFGFSPDLIVGDMDSIKPKKTLKAYQKKQIVLFDKDKDDSDTVIALKEALKHAANREDVHICLCGGDGGRIDHLLGIVKQFESAVFPDIWLCRKQVVLSLRSRSDGKPAVLGIEARRCSEYISIFPVPALNGDYRITSQGLVWPLDTVDWKDRGFSLSNRITEDYLAQGHHVVLEAKQGAFIVIVPY